MDVDPDPETNLNLPHHSLSPITTKGSLPKIDETSAYEGRASKQRVIELLDVLEGHVENVRKEALKLEEERDSLLASLDSVKNADVMIQLSEIEREDVLFYVERITKRCHTVELKVHTQRDKSQEEALHQINHLIDSLIVGIKIDPEGTHNKCLAYMNACSSQVVQGITDKNFESSLLGCTIDDQKWVKKRLQGLLSYINKTSVSSDIE